MFLKPNIMKKLMKNAYKGNGLKVATIADNGGGIWICIGGMTWSAEVRFDMMSKQFKGDLISLIGELPNIGESFTATKDGNQVSIGEFARNPEEIELGKMIAVTNVLVYGNEDVEQRILQDYDTYEVYAVSNIYVDCVDPDMVLDHKGETRVEGPYKETNGMITWINNSCALHISTREDIMSDKELASLKGVDLIPCLAD